MTACIEMPKYQCHKQVWALEIKDVKVSSEGSGVITPANGRYAPFEVKGSYIEKHKPYPGGYYMLYKGGYESFSPADALKDGYSLVNDSMPITTLFDFYEVSSLFDLVRELVLHVDQLQESAKRNVKPWEDTFPATLLPSYIQRVKEADSAANPQIENDGREG